MSQTTVKQKEYIGANSSVSHNGYVAQVNSINLDGKEKEKKLDPSPEVIQSLRDSAYAFDNRGYRKLIDKIDWEKASAKSLNTGLSAAIVFTDLRRAEKISKIGLEKYPDDEVFIRIQPLFNPPKARVGKNPWTVPKPPNFLNNSMDWIDENQDNYEIGHWLAVYDGILVADAPTRRELGEILDARRAEDHMARHALIYKVI